MPNRRARGTLGEDTAVDYLEKKGYRILQRNFRFERGEIDIVAEDGGVLVFVEVKARRTKTYGEPEDAVTVSKRKQIRKVAEGYLFKNDIDGRECRFDVVAIVIEGDRTIVRHCENAF